MSAILINFRRLFSGLAQTALTLPVILLAVAAAWTLVASLLSDSLIRSRGADLIESERRQVTRSADALTLNLGQNLAQMHGFPAALADEREIAEALDALEKDNAAARRPTAELAADLHARSDLAMVNRHLDVMARELDYDLIFALDASGRCIVSSNGGKPDSLVGTNFADREYFQTAMRGERAQQYAIGRATNIAGLFFSAPVLRDGRPIGIVATKINMPRLQHWVKDVNAFITDSNGIVILAHDPALMMRSVDPERLAALPDAARVARYKRTEFPPLRIEPASEFPSSDLVRIDGDPTPTVLTQRPRPNDGVTLYVWSRIGGLASVERDVRWVVLLVFVGGSAVTLLVLGALGYVARSRRHLAEVREKEQAAHQANVAKGEFLANMSHEIRTPMNAVIGLTQLALKTRLDAKQRDYLTKIKISAASLLGIINDILDYSKIEAGKMTIESVEFSLKSVLDSVSNVSSLRAAEKKLELAFLVDPDVPMRLIGDPLRLGQILLNLVNNAIKFTERGDVILAICVRSRGEKTVELAFHVQDTGIGMSEEQQTNLFQPFNQADASTTRKFGGTGLGLAISKQIAEMMGGTLSVMSAPGQGSLFSCTALMGVQETREEIEHPEQMLANLRVLVVDDNAMAREILSGTLLSWSMQVQTASSGWEAIAAVQNAAGRQAPFDLVLLDWQMPDPDGLKTAQVILSAQWLEKKPHIIMVSAHTHDEIMANIDRVGIDAFLSKPIEKSILLETIISIMVRREQYSQAISGTPPQAQHDLRGVRVLLAEDNEINQQIALEFLSEAGVEVEIAVNGREAVDKIMAAGGRYDAVLMDVQMPEMDGLEATRRLREHFDSAALPILAMTAHAMERERRRCLESGMDDHIAKPIDPKEMLDTLARWVGRRKRDTASLAAAPPLMAPLPAPPGGSLPEVASPPAIPATGLPEELPPFGLGGALARLGGRQELVRRIIVGFHESFAGAPETLDRLAAENRLDELERLAHTLKSAAATLEADDLSEAAADLEHTLHDGMISALPPLVTALKDKLAPALAAAARMAAAPTINDTAPPAARAAVDRSKVDQTIRDLGALLARNNPKARKLVAALADDLEGHGFGEALDAVSKSLNRFDFRGAEAALAALSGRLDGADTSPAIRETR